MAEGFELVDLVYGVVPVEFIGIAKHIVINAIGQQQDRDAPITTHKRNLKIASVLGKFRRRYVLGPKGMVVMEGALSRNIPDVGNW